MTRFTMAIAALGLVATGCGDDGPVAVPANASDAMANYADIVYASYLDSHTAAVALKGAVDAFVAAPSDETLAVAREAWLDSREPYLQTEVYRFYDGPIDNPVDGPEGLLNAWPLDESHIDDIVAGSDAITAAFLEGQNETPNEDSISVGYHAVEYLLWGADTSDTGAGDRPATDYTDADNADRRTTYLTTVTDMLLGHLEMLVTAWAADATNYRADFAAATNEDALARVLTGMVVLSGFETGGERLQTALDTGLQEDEHSCFSDNTHRDMVQDVQGIANVWKGTYTKLDGTVHEGTGVHEVIKAADAELASQIDAQIAESLTLAKALQPPFDQEIKAGNAEGNARVQALIDALTVQNGLLEDAFRLFGLAVPQPE